MKSLLRKVLFANNWENRKILVAVSGGVDSMVLAAALKDLSQQIVIAHCNFGLRGDESNGDEQLVREWASSHKIECQIKHFDTPGILKNEGGNLQETARNLRYQWFEDLRQQLDFDFIATAHHKQDSVETMLMNFFKGTGIAGMHGILPQQNKIIRPLLAFTKDELLQYATENNLLWREDSSNKKTDYTRNAIRKQLMPVLEQLFPNVLNNLASNTQRFSEVEALYNVTVSKLTKSLIEQRQQDFYIPILKLKKQPAPKTLLWEMLQHFNFSAAQLDDIFHLTEAESGRLVASHSHRIIKDRDFLIITALQKEESTFVLIQEEDQSVVFSEGSLQLKFSEKVPDLDSLKNINLNEICVDVASIHFPLILRPWKIGDYFYPLGTQPKKKKVSKYLIEQKVPLHEKEKIWVLESNQKIIWVLGRRADDRFKVKKHSVNVLFISVN
jgi:tRNA(Ile)-lysidine synthase